MKTIQQDLKSMNLSVNEAIDMAQNRPLWRLMSTFGVWCMPETNERQLVMDHDVTQINNFIYYNTLIWCRVCTADIIQACRQRHPLGQLSKNN